MPHVSLRVAMALSTALAALASSGAAQLISLKTVPVASGDQFLLFPSRNLGMGGPSIALEDAWLDPYANPAKGARVGESRVFAAPTFYSISNTAGSARTLPTGATFRSGGWFGGATAALQQLERDEVFFPQPWFLTDVVPDPNALSQRSQTNKYVHLMLGQALPGGLAVGGSAFLADLNAVDGVEHLYAMAAGIEQSGVMQDVRFGVTRETPEGHLLEAVALYHHFDVAHDVAYVDWVVTDSVLWQWEPRTRVEHNVDRTNTWGLHLGYRRPIGEAGWRAGGTITANRKSHPKIPNYEIMNIPRDPGFSTAFDVGLGLAKVTPTTTFGLDVVYEPARSETWAEAEQTVTTAGGGTIAAGGRTVENAFRFSNAFVNVGLAHEIRIVTFQLGLQIRAYDYRLEQQDHVAETFRTQNEAWMEWVPSWGFAIRLTDLEIRYLGRVTTGTGRPGTAWTGAVAERALDFQAANDIMLAPSGPLTLQDVTVTTHQIGVSLPIR